MKKIFVLILSLLFLVSLVGCNPKLAELTEESAIEYVKSLSDDYLMKLYDLYIQTNADINHIRKFCNLENLDKVEDDKGGILINKFQARIDEVFGKGRYSVTDLFEDFIVDGYVMSVNHILLVDDAVNVRYSDAYDVSYNIKEVQEKYIIVEYIYSQNLIYEESEQTLEQRIDYRTLYTVYPTTKGLKIWDIATGLADRQLVVEYPETFESIGTNMRIEFVKPYYDLEVEVCKPFTYEEGSSIPNEIKDKIIVYPETATIDIGVEVFDEVGHYDILVKIILEDEKGNIITRNQKIGFFVMDYYPPEIIVKEGIPHNLEELASMITVIDPIYGELTYDNSFNKNPANKTWSFDPLTKEIDFSYTNEGYVVIIFNDNGSIGGRSFKVVVGPK